ncbi:hypothetical protein N7468_002066 [Penicillium chermesinum]|uniref:Uncharacterized protein n=1 Tax=Penicillium chermesinum TaxID=63820 RepID=A0A9W9PHU2_9EURO|nr:uncharacterized protein N7468_002066 [Penicillium chermesinum]KAJ5247083.1 hypothetical protein N7468_002066 [Penicillium chermesinum]
MTTSMEAAIELRAVALVVPATSHLHYARLGFPSSKRLEREIESGVRAAALVRRRVERLLTSWRTKNRRLTHQGPVDMVLLR